MAFCSDNINDLWKIWENPCPYQNKSMKVGGTDPLFVGWSVAALRSNFIMKVARKSFDAGLPCPYPIDEIYLTHGHCDHSASLFFYTLKNKNLRILVPREILEITDEKIQKDYHLTESVMKYGPARYSIIGVEGGDCIPTTFMGHNALIEIFNSHHSVPTVSYGISIEKKTLKEKYKGLGPAEMGLIARSGIEVSKKSFVPYFLYVGDTDISIFNRPVKKAKNWFLTLLFEFFTLLFEFFDQLYPNDDEKRIFYANELPNYQEHNRNIIDYPIIMIECTFLLYEDYDYSKEKKHIHWKDLKPFFELYPNTQFILYHFSQRYKKSQIEEFLRDRPKNVTPWISK